MEQRSNQITVNIIGIALAVIFTAWYFHSCNPQPVVVRTVKLISEIHDTTEKIIQVPVLRGEGKSKIVYRDTQRDSVANAVSNPERDLHSMTQNRMGETSDISHSENGVPFIARLDTIQGKDTLHLEFYFPEAIFKYSIFRAPDSIQVINTTKTIENTVYVEPPLYQKPIFTIPATIAAMLAILLAVQ